MRQAVCQLAFAAAAVLIFAQPRAASAQQTHGPSAAGASVFHTNCATCHGDDGSGSEVGKSLQAPDLRSSKVQMQSNAALARFISEGKGAMPPFNATLSHQQILDAVRYVRTLPKHPGAHK